MSNHIYNLIIFYIAYNLITCSRDKIRSRNLDSHQPNLQKNVIKIINQCSITSLSFLTNMNYFWSLIKTICDEVMSVVCL